MRFLDLHAHPVFKTLFNALTPWDPIPASDRLIGDIIESQSNFQQITKNVECNLICMTLHPPEVGMLDQWIMKLAPLFTNAFESNIMQKMISGNFDYQQVMHKELSNLKNFPRNRTGLKPIIILADFKQYDPDDFINLYVIFNIEGGHSFYNKGNRYENKQKILEDFRIFATRKDLLTLYITPTHLTPNIFITHAYGNKILGKGKLLPKGCGISSDGKAFLDEIVNTNLLIDVKHMSLVARQIFYKNLDWNKKPFICSHAGLTGCSWKDILNSDVIFHAAKVGPGFVKIRYVKPTGILKGTYFNPCSINLYDEDIMKILESDGIIGISFDLRIIGGDRNLWGNLKLTEKEFLSSEEFEVWKNKSENYIYLKHLNYELPYTGEMIGGEVSDDIWDEEDIRDELEELNSLYEKDILDLYMKSMLSNGEKRIQNFIKERELEHTRYFANQILHIVKVAGSAGFKGDPWKKICIGTDFDGFIRAIDSCKNISNLEKFRDMLIDLLDKEDGISLPRSATEIVNDIFFHNAFKLISDHLS
jgi:microsomal dipeptidase-like Zn-dependent dipeptidase